MSHNLTVLLGHRQLAAATSGEFRAANLFPKGKTGGFYFKNFFTFRTGEIPSPTSRAFGQLTVMARENFTRQQSELKRTVTAKSPVTL